MTRWTPNEYDELFEDLDQEIREEVTGNELFNEFEEPDSGGSEADEINLPNPNRKYGVKQQCVFNQLESFHCVTSM